MHDIFRAIKINKPTTLNINTTLKIMKINQPAEPT